MADSNEKFKWLKPFFHLFVFSLLCSTVCADNSTNTTDYPEEFEDFLLIEPAPLVIPECGRNEVYQSCEVNCIDCEHRGMCEPQNCHTSHCDCRMYFVHKTPGGPCEHVSSCPSRECPENEVYRHCGSFCEACDAFPCRSMECSSRCYCKQGYRRNTETGKCIPEKECPERLKCLANDEVAKSGPFSDHCMQTESEALRVNETIEEEKCYCKSGFKRNIHGWCIEEEICSYVTCVEQTEFQECPRKCNTTCWNYGDPDCKEDGQCYPACFCPEGFVLNEFFACVSIEMCPPGSNPFAPPLPPPTVSPIPEPDLEETSNSSSLATTETGLASAVSISPGTENSSSAAAESNSGKGSSSAVAGSSSGSGSSSAVAESSSGSGSSSAVAESSSGTGSSSSAAGSSSESGSSSAVAGSGSGSGSSSAVAGSSSGSGSSSSVATSSSGLGSSSAVAASSSESGSSSAVAASSSASAVDSAADSESSTDAAGAIDKSKEKQAGSTPEDVTPETPKKPPKKVPRSGKIYKSAARPGKTVAPPLEDA